MPKPKSPRKKKASDKYKNAGRLAINKMEKQERAERRRERLKARSERRKERKANPDKARSTQIDTSKDAVIENDWLSKSKREAHDHAIEKRKTMFSKDKRTIGWWESLYAKMRNELKKQEEEEKKNNSSNRSVKNKKGKVTTQIKREEEQYNVKN